MSSRGCTLEAPTTSTSVFWWHRRSSVSSPTPRSQLLVPSGGRSGISPSDVEHIAPVRSLGQSRRRGCTKWRRTSMAATELQAIVRFRFHDGDVEEFKRLSAQCMEIVRTQDTGTLQYDTFF